MLTTLLDVLGILLVIVGIAIWFASWAPLWAAFTVAGALVMLFSLVMARFGGVK